MIFYQSSYSYFFLTFLIIGSHIVFISILGLLSRSLKPNIYADSLKCLILQCSSLSIILTLSHKRRWFPFSFHICSAIPDFSISLRTTAYRCSYNFIFSGRHVSPLYTLPQLQGVGLSQFMTMLNSVGCLTRKRYPWRVERVVNIVLMSYELHILWILSARPLTKKTDILWWVFGFRHLFSDPGFLEPMLCALGSCYDGAYVLN